MVSRGQRQGHHGHDVRRLDLHQSAEPDLSRRRRSDRRDGVDSPEARMLRWDERVPGRVRSRRLPARHRASRMSRGRSRAIGPGARSRNAGMRPAGAFRRSTSRTRARASYAKDVLRFWMDLGVQGFEYDTPTVLLGDAGGGRSAPDRGHDRGAARAPSRASSSISMPRASGRTKTRPYSDRIGFTHIMINGDDDMDSFATRAGRVPPTGTVDQLEEQWADLFRSRVGRPAAASTPCRCTTSTSIHGSGHWTRRSRPAWAPSTPSTTRSSSRTRMARSCPRRPSRACGMCSGPCGSHPRSRPRHRASGVPAGRRSARLRHQADEHRRQQDGAARLQLQRHRGHDHARPCRDSGITVPQRSIDLATGEPGPSPRDDPPTLTLEPYGYRFLDVQVSEPAGPQMDPDFDYP